jgi:Lrp/AsnC family transcriptional regulator, leucine-responsive regulatory protein
MQNLSEFERQLVKLLAENSRRSVTELSLRLKSSRPKTRGAIESLHHKGVIKRFTVELDKIDKADVSGVRAFFVVKLGAPKCKALFATIRNWPEVIDAWSLSSPNVDMQIQVQARSHQDLERLRDKVATHPVVENMWTTVILKDWRHDRLE